MFVSIREFCDLDCTSLIMLSNDEWNKGLQFIVAGLKDKKNNVGSCLVAEDDKQIVGFIYGFILPNKTLIPEFIYVIPNYRNKGVGRMLLEELEKRSKCTVSMIFYHKTLREHYAKQGYVVGNNLETAIKQLVDKGESNGEI